MRGWARVGAKPDRGPADRGPQHPKILFIQKSGLSCYPVYKYPDHPPKAPGRTRRGRTRRGRTRRGRTRCGRTRRGRTRRGRTRPDERGAAVINPALPGPPRPCRVASEARAAMPRRGRVRGHEASAQKYALGDFSLKVPKGHAPLMPSLFSLFFASHPRSALSHSVHTHRKTGSSSFYPMVPHLRPRPPGSFHR